MADRPRMVRRDDAVLVVVDVQERLAAAMEHRERVVASTTRLLRVAVLLGWPIVVTRQYPEGLGDLVPELHDLLAGPEFAGGATVVDKTAFACTAEPPFVEALERAGRPQVVLAGMETHVCVAQTALALHAGGIGTYVAADACCSQRDTDAKLALQRMRRDGVVVSTSEALMYEAVGRAATDEFRALLRIVKGG